MYAYFKKNQKKGYKITRQYRQKTKNLLKTKKA